MPQIAPALVAGLGTAGTAAAGTAVAGTAVAGAATAGLSASAIFASTAMTVAGSLIGGIGKSMFEKDQMKELEAQQIREEERRQASYKGVGAATRIWDKEQASPLKNSASVAPSNTMNAPAQPKPSSVKYNPATRKIEAA